MHKCNHESVKDLDFEWDADKDLIVRQECKDCGVMIVKQYKLYDTTIYAVNENQIERN